MTLGDDIGEFLASRRARVTPERAGLPDFGRRRVPGLRREEVASLASVGVDYYRRLERGHIAGASDSVLDAIAGALQLDDAERAHLFELAHAARPTAPRRSRPIAQRIRPEVQRILDGLTLPAAVGNSRLDYLAANALGRALYEPMFRSREQPPNGARFTFLDPAAIDFYPEWDRVADDLVAHLRSESGRNPHDRGLAELVGQLSIQSPEFRARPSRPSSSMRLWSGRLAAVGSATAGAPRRGCPAPRHERLFRSCLHSSSDNPRRRPITEPGR